MIHYMPFKKRNKLIQVMVTMMIIERLHNLAKTCIMWHISLSKSIVKLHEIFEEQEVNFEMPTFTR
jgi:hypothetical protein